MSNPNAPVLSPRDVPIDVWPVGQHAPAAQRRSRYLPESRRHPAKMLPALARRVIEIYAAPCACALDPLSGIGTTGVEAAHLGRRYLGVELEGGYAETQAANLRLARAQGAAGRGVAMRGDARELPALLWEHRKLVEREWKIALPELTSPPYGPATKGGGIGAAWTCAATAATRTPATRPISPTWPAPTTSRNWGPSSRTASPC